MMNARSMVIYLFWVTALIGVAIWLNLEHQGRLRLGDQNRALRQQLGPMAGVVVENERLSNLVAQVNSSQSLPGDQLKELLRLRGQVGVLRQQSKELEALRVENREARAATEAAAATANYWPRDSLVFAGYASPEAALQSFLWAANKGDVKTLLGGLNIPKEAEKELEGKSGNEIAAMLSGEVARFKAVRVLSREVQADDTVVLTLANEMKYPTTNKAFMKRSGNEWKLDLD